MTWMISFESIFERNICWNIGDTNKIQEIQIRASDRIDSIF